jgi:hypothetical protein
MIYRLPPVEDALDQGDLIDGCPVHSLLRFDPDNPDDLETKTSLRRILVLSQTCDLANQKATRVIVASVFAAENLIQEQILKAADVRGPIRAGRVFGWYFLPKNVELKLPEMIVDLRQLHTVRLDLLRELCRRGRRQARVQPLYREHRAKHFADTYSRIGLPEPYETD